MKRSILAVSGIVVLGLLASHVEGQDPPADDPQEYAKLTQPGPEHERLHALVGTWDLTVEGAKEKGKAEFKSILGGRFLTEEARLPFEEFSMEWLGVYGFDKQKGKYTAFWVDNMNTTTEATEGDADETGKILSFRGQHIDPRTGKPAPFIWRITRESDTKITIEMFEVDAEKNEHPVFAFQGEKTK